MCATRNSPCFPWSPAFRGTSCHGLAPRQLLRLARIRYGILRLCRLSRLCNRQWSSPSWQTRHSYARQHETSQNRNWQHILFYLLNALNFRHTKHDALHLIIYTSAGFERCGHRVTGEIIEVSLEEPKGLECVSWAQGRNSWRNLQVMRHSRILHRDRV